MRPIQRLVRQPHSPIDPDWLPAVELRVGTRLRRYLPVERTNFHNRRMLTGEEKYEKNQRDRSGR